MVMPSSSSTNSTNNNNNNNIAPFAQIAGTCWAIAPWYPRETAPKYYAWDVLCAVYLLDNSVVEFDKRVLSVNAIKGHPETGKIIGNKNHHNTGDEGNVFVAKNVNQDLFYRVLRTALQL
jgi:inosine-uridine nucleoside N-ribohydrolase